MAAVITEARADLCAPPPRMLATCWHPRRGRQTAIPAPNAFLLVTAEAVGFEPTGRHNRPPVFKTGAFGRSATPPGRQVCQPGRSVPCPAGAAAATLGA